MILGLSSRVFPALPSSSWRFQTGVKKCSWEEVGGSQAESRGELGFLHPSGSQFLLQNPRDSQAGKELVKEKKRKDRVPPRQSVWTSSPAWQRDRTESPYPRNGLPLPGLRADSLLPPEAPECLRKAVGGALEGGPSRGLLSQTGQEPRDKRGGSLWQCVYQETQIHTLQHTGARKAHLDGIHTDTKG